MTALATVDLEAFRENVRALARIAEPAETMLAVKADAYGHGLIPLARAALEAGATSLACLDIPAALELRAAGITAPLFAWLHGPQSDFAAAARAQIELGVSAEWQLDAIESVAPEFPVRVHLKVDTGLHRNGASPEDWPALVGAALAAQDRGAVTVYGVWSHLADASPADDAIALAAFLDAVAVAKHLGAEFARTHLAASSAGIRMPQARLDLVRFGIAAYGVSPFDDVDGHGLGLTAPMTLSTSVTAVDAEAGTATIGIGFADGLAASAVPGAEVLIRGKRCRLVDVDVDSSTVAIADASLGDGVLVFGPGEQGEPTAEEWAAWAGSIGDEIIARVASRVPRHYVNA